MMRQVDKLLENQSCYVNIALLFFLSDLKTWLPWRSKSGQSLLKAFFGESVSNTFYFNIYIISVQKWTTFSYHFLAKLVPVGYGIKKLQIGCVVEDDKVSIDWLTEEIQNFEDLVQSVDIAAFNKI